MDVLHIVGMDGGQTTILYELLKREIEIVEKPPVGEVEFARGVGGVDELRARVR